MRFPPSHRMRSLSPYSLLNVSDRFNRPRQSKTVPARTALSERISRDLKKGGFRFVGSTIIYAYLQAVGVVNDHAPDCFRYAAR